MKHIKELQEDTKDLNDQLKYKEKRQGQAASSRNYEICDQLTEEMAAVEKQKSARKSTLVEQKAATSQSVQVQMQVISFRLIHLTNVIMRLDSSVVLHCTRPQAHFLVHQCHPLLNLLVAILLAG